MKVLSKSMQGASKSTGKALKSRLFFLSIADLFLYSLTINN